MFLCLKMRVLQVFVLPSTSILSVKVSGVLVLPTQYICERNGLGQGLRRSCVFADLLRVARCVCLFGGCLVLLQYAELRTLAVSVRFSSVLLLVQVYLMRCLRAGVFNVAFLGLTRGG